MASSILTPMDFLYVADQSAAKVWVKPDDRARDVEVFQRVIPFDATGSSQPAFKKVPGIFTSGETRELSCPVLAGSLYQALAFPRDSIPQGSLPARRDFPRAIGRVELPAFHVEARQPLLTACSGDPQISLNHHGNTLRAALATGARETRMLLLVGNEKPALFSTGQGDMPRFGVNGSMPVALGSSRNSARIHRVEAPSNTDFAKIDQFPPGEPYWFIALVWTKDGRWDFAWSKKAAGQPLKKTAPIRTIEADVRQLTCVNDDSFDGDPVFTLALKDRGGQALESDTYEWKDMSTGEMVTLPRLSLEWSSDSGSEPVSISIAAGDDGVWEGEFKLPPFPVGDGAQFNERMVRITGINGLGSSPVFYADVNITVSYG